MKIFKPSRSDFFNLFKEISHYINDISVLFSELSKEFDNFESYAVNAKRIEHLTDEKASQVVTLLNSTFITPFDREDIYTLINELDDIVDLTEDAIHKFHLYKVNKRIPAVEEFAVLINQGANYTEKLVLGMEEQKYTPELAKIRNAVHDLEDQGDKIFGTAISSLFTEEKDPVSIIKEKDILECLENILDKYQKVSDIIEGILVKSS